jgi:hypothetical protein
MSLIAMRRQAPILTLTNAIGVYFRKERQKVRTDGSQ